MTTLVTGAAGFVGSAICRRLLAEGETVVGIDCITDYYDIAIKERNIAALDRSPLFSFVKADLSSVDLAPILRGVDHLYHQAGQPGVRKSWGEDFAVYVDANISVTQRLLEAATGANLKKFVYASSSSIYGNADCYPTMETTMAQPLSPYGVTKLAAEHLCTLYAKNHGLPTVSLRYFTVYGPGQRPDMAFTKFCFEVLRDRAIPLYGSGKQIRDFTYVDDVVSANIKAARGETAPGAVFNVAGGSNASMLDVIETLENISGKSIHIDRSSAVAGDVERTGGDVESIKRVLGWEPKVGLRQGLEKQFQWAKDSLEEGVSSVY